MARGDGALQLPLRRLHQPGEDDDRDAQRAEAFDLRGEHRDEQYGRPREIYVEVKNYTSEGSLASDWIDFVANAYSATHLAWDRLGRDPELEFMFASMHPWSVSKYWNLTEPDELRQACERRGDSMPEGGPLDDRLRVLSTRLIPWVIARRQQDMTMGRNSGAT
jgi:hypothetical protein